MYMLVIHKLLTNGNKQVTVTGNHCKVVACGNADLLQVGSHIYGCGTVTHVCNGYLLTNTHYVAVTQVMGDMHFYLGMDAARNFTVKKG